MGEFDRLAGSNVLNGLTMGFEDVNTENNVALLSDRRVNDFIIRMILVIRKRITIIHYSTLNSHTIYFKAFNPLIQNSNAVCKFSGEGAVTKIDE